MDGFVVVGSVAGGLVVIELLFWAVFGTSLWYWVKRKGDRDDSEI